MPPDHQSGVFGGIGGILDRSHIVLCLPQKSQLGEGRRIGNPRGTSRGITTGAFPGRDEPRPDVR